MKTRGLVVAVATLLAVLATGAVFVYVHGVKKSATVGGGTESVLVAKQDIAVGTKLDDVVAKGAITIKQFPKGDVVRGAVTELSQIKGTTTNAPVLAGEQLTTARLQGSTTQPTGGVLGIPSGYEALTVSLEVPQAGGGVVQKGDHISIFATLSNLSLLRGSSLKEFLSGKGAPSNDEQKLPDFVVTVVADVKVLKVVQGAISSTTTGSQVALTLALKPDDVAKVVLAEQKADIWLTLLPPNETGQPVPPTGFIDLLTTDGPRPV